MSFHESVKSYAQQRHEEGQGEDESHPETRLLRAYHEGSLPGEQTDRIQEHLALCAECGDAFLGLVNFLEWDLDPTRLSADDLASSWEGFLEKKRGAAEEELCEAEAARD